MNYIQTIKGREQQLLCVSAVGKTTAGALGLRVTKETMRATLEIALLLLAGYFTLTDGVSELLQVTDCNMSRVLRQVYNMYIVLHTF